MTWSATSHHLNQTLLIVNWTRAISRIFNTICALCFIDSYIYQQFIQESYDVCILIVSWECFMSTRTIQSNMQCIALFHDIPLQMDSESQYHNLGIMIATKTHDETWNVSWWRHQMETVSALLAICAGISPVTGEIPAQRPVTWSFDVE